MFSHSVMSDSLRSHRFQPARRRCPWSFPGKNTGVDFYSKSNYKLQKINLKNKKLNKQKQDHMQVLSESVHQMEKYLQRSKGNRTGLEEKLLCNAVTVETQRWVEAGMDLLACSNSGQGDGVLSPDQPVLGCPCGTNLIWVRQLPSAKEGLPERKSILGYQQFIAFTTSVHYISR